jgi:hypothetical protein
MKATYKKPPPLYGALSRALCPICGHVSYSPAGVHPQCAMRACDQVLNDRLKVRKMAAKPKPTRLQPGRFEKQCPMCGTIQHIRKQDCSCGHSFVSKDNRADNRAVD